MNRNLVLLTTLLAPLWLCACSADEAIAEIPSQPVRSTAEKPAPPASSEAWGVWPLGVAP